MGMNSTNLSTDWLIPFLNTSFKNYFISSKISIKESKFLSKVFVILFVDLNIILQDSWSGVVLTDVSEGERLAVLSKLSTSFSVQDILEPFFKVFFSEWWPHDWEYSSQWVNQDDSGESWIQVELVLKFLVVTCLSPQKAYWLVSEIINDLKLNKKSYSFDCFQINSSFLLGWVNQSRQESDNTQWHFKTDTIFVPCLFVHQPLN